MKSGSDLIPLAQVRQELQDASDLLGLEVAALNAVRHRTIQGAALDGLLPARRERGRWYVRRGDLPKIAEALGIIQPKKSGRPPRSDIPSNAAVAA
jgi:hypothetical protein